MKKVLLGLVLVLISGIALYPWLFMEPNPYRVPSLIVVGPLFLMFCWMSLFLDLTPFQWTWKQLCNFVEKESAHEPVNAR